MTTFQAGDRRAAGRAAVTSTLTVGARRYRVHPVDAPARLPYSLRILLENLLRHDAPAEQVRAVAGWRPRAERTAAVDLHPSRVFLHDTNGVPALADLAAMRDAMASLGGDPARVNPAVPAELVVDHSIIADAFGGPGALARNTRLEYERNAERYRFLRWGQASLRGFTVVPPGKGIMHQINVEHLARVVMRQDGAAFPDLCLGTDSHTTMVNGLGTLGWGVGGIEAEAAMLGQPVSMLVPDVVGVRLHGVLPPAATATDLVLTLTELLREHGVVGKIVEFHGPGVTALPVTDRVTISNMSPEFGSTAALFPIDAETVRYLRFTGRAAEHADLVEAYARAQGLWHDPRSAPAYTAGLDLDLSTVTPSIAGPRRPQDRIPLDAVRTAFRAQHRSGAGAAGGRRIGHGAVAIAAITSCTNTSNPFVMVAAGLLARNAVQRGLRAAPWVKTTLSPGSRVVMDYYAAAGLTPYLEQLGFHLTGYGCMTCIGASGPLTEEMSRAVAEHDLDVAAVLSGNRNFEGRIQPEVRSSYLASPPLVVAYAIAGTIDLDLTTEPLGTDPDGRPVHLHDLWPGPSEVRDVMREAIRPSMFARAYAGVLDGDERWRRLDAPSSATFPWDPASTYVRRAPYLDGMPLDPPPVTDIEGARVLVMLGDSITTDHISPAGAIPPSSPAGRYLTGLGVPPDRLNTYASRRGDHDVMTRGAFANVRLRNALVPGVEGGFTADLLDGGRIATVHAAARAYQAASVPAVVLAGEGYGAGSSRDWAAKGPALLGVRAVIAKSYERIHRSNLVGMGVLPLQFLPGEGAGELGLTGREAFTVHGLAPIGAGRVPPTVTVTAGDVTFRARVRLDTPREAYYHRHGGILPYVLRDLLARPAGVALSRG
ncbi:aconitate hydratase AcnA [Nonomuraea sp. KC401]|uniref:aconitate hydratase AcnA n=1 Tax=unclassified Nonomuraea TaxID=2593643 RepID=UPI0010FE0767|nr:MULTISPECIES: aconitate hydratase AcnA [unclassified Nonomuraea]NBE92671.1 aconitate hydratase AcnA [Nonomuraea sp. K271]TLF84621.1 aconitate hydratase AcnA [Nonomuraea sp. KC401]